MAPIIGIRTWDLHLEGCLSLKDKRSVIKPLTGALRRDLNVSVAETGHQDLWQRALVAAVTVASDHAHGELVLQTVEREASELLGPQLVSAVVEWL